MNLAFRSLLAGIALGGLPVWLWSRRLLAEQAALDAQLAALRGQLRCLRHDMRGILSPALLVADRLLTHEEAQVKRAGEVVTRAVERAVTRLSEASAEEKGSAQKGSAQKGSAQPGPASTQP